MFDTNTPIYLQVMRSLETEIATGRYPPGEKLPGGRELALQYGINPNTAARVYQELEKTGLCETRRGLGTFVTNDPALISEAREELAREAARQYLTRAAQLGMAPAEAIEMILEEGKKQHA